MQRVARLLAYCQSVECFRWMLYAGGYKYKDVIAQTM